MTATISTADNYDATLAEATAILTARVEAAGFPEHEFEKAIGDALNNQWFDGITVDAWVAGVMSALQRD